MQAKWLNHKLLNSITNSCVSAGYTPWALIEAGEMRGMRLKNPATYAPRWQTGPPAFGASMAARRRAAAELRQQQQAGPSRQQQRQQQRGARFSPRDQTLEHGSNGHHHHAAEAEASTVPSFAPTWLGASDDRLESTAGHHLEDALLSSVSEQRHGRRRHARGAVATTEPLSAATVLELLNGEEIKVEDGAAPLTAHQTLPIMATPGQQSRRMGGAIRRSAIRSERSSEAM